MRSFILHENRWTPRIQVEAFVYAPPKVVDSPFSSLHHLSIESSGIQWNLLFQVEINERILCFLFEN